jgi:SPP1 gp7 family putative phage head morphogenesis protein
MARGHEWKAERIRRDVPFLERARGRLRHRLMGALRELAGAGEAVAYDVAPFAQFVSVAVDALLDTFGQVYPRAARTALEIASGAVRFARRDPQLPDFLRRWYRAEAERHLSRYAARERELIRRVVQRAYLRGGDAREVAREVSRRILSVAGWQAERIARTELMRFYNLAHYGVYQSLPRGVVVGYEYSVVLDDRTSHVCRGLAGKRVEAHRLRHLPPFHPHCRTVLIPIFAAEQAEEGVAYVDPEALSIPPGWGNIEGLPLPQSVDVGRVVGVGVGSRSAAAGVVAPVGGLVFPESGEGLEVVGELGGSTGAVLVRDGRGQLWVRKYGVSEAQVLHEHLAHALYRAVGVAAPESRVYVDGRGRAYLLSEYVGDGRQLRELAGEALERAHEALRRGFVMDALLENYDVVGLERDNILVRGDGTVVRVDNGGSFSTRAGGGRKSYRAELQALWSLRGRRLLDGRAYRSAATEVFGGVDLEALLGQMGEVLGRRDALEAVLGRFESGLPAGVSRGALAEVRGSIEVLRARLRLLEALYAGLVDMREDFVDDYVERWGLFYEALLSDGEQVLRDVVERYRGVLDVASRARFLSDVGDAVSRARDGNVEQLWRVYEGRGVEDVERVRAAADRMVAHHKVWSDKEYAYVMRQLANRFMRRFETAEFEYAQYVGRSIEAIVAGDAERSGLDVSHYERGFMAMHAMSYAVLRRLCVEPPSPVFGADGTIRVGRVLADDAELRGESSLRVLATGSSPYQVFRVARLWALGVARVPVRRILTNVLLNTEFYYNESEHLLMGGQRWGLVFGAEMKDEMEPVLGHIEGDIKMRYSVLLRIMQIWERSGDEEFVRALRDLWRELRAAHGQL